MKFTPIMLNGERGEMEIDEGFSAMFRRGKEWRATITDRKSGKVYAVKSAECSLQGCLCDAVVVMECK